MITQVVESPRLKILKSVFAQCSRIYPLSNGGYQHYCCAVPSALGFAVLRCSWGGGGGGGVVLFTCDAGGT